jgi:hypothetical protein
MKTIMKALAGALLAGGIGLAAAGPAKAAVHVGIGFPGPIAYPAPYYGPPPYYVPASLV